MATKRFDFSGYATRNDILCGDGRVIKQNAFKDNDGNVVPLVYMHSHDNVDQVLGHALLENRNDGVYAYCSLNNTPQGQSAKEEILHGDLKYLSIYANHLKHNGNEVVHGNIRELSLVLSGANPGAYIDTVNIAHGADEDEEAIIYNTSTINTMPCWVSTEIKHSDTDPEDEKKNKKDDIKSADINEVVKTEIKEEKPNEEVSISKTEIKEDLPVEDIKETSDKDDKDNKNKELKHADDNDTDDKDEKSVEEIWNSFTKDQKDAVYAIITIAKANPEELNDLDGLIKSNTASKEIKHSDESSNKTIKNVWNTLTDEQKNVAAVIIAETISSMNKDEAKHSDFEGGNEMTKNLFENNGVGEEEQVLSHDDMMAVLDDVKHGITLKNSFLQHGITNIDVMFPDDQMVGTQPITVERDRNWVDEVLDNVTKNPFARIKCVYADITADEARAKGFAGSSLYKDKNGKPLRDSKGNLVDNEGNRIYKEEEVIAMSKRSVGPTTVYKKQRLDRNDISDIVDFDVVVWLKQEMKAMLNEEVARAILIGDGRNVTAPDKIDETCIKPIWTDEDFFTIKAAVNKVATDTEDTIAEKLIDLAVLAKKNYKGSGSTVCFINEDYLTRMLLLKDTMGHRLYKTEQELAAAMRVTKFVSVPVFQGVTRTDNDSNTRSLVGIIVNLKDYRVGTDKKGQVTMFDDFDIDVNQEKYLIETRLSGMETVPYSAIALEVIEPAG